jgi:hypothetical protein
MRRSLRSIGVAMLALGTWACTSTSPPPDLAADHVTTSPPPPPMIDGLTIHEPTLGWRRSGWELHLAWDPPAEGPVDHYRVSRDGTLVDGDVVLPSWTDRTVVPGTRYTYSVVGVMTDGKRARPQHTTIRTDFPPLEDARLQGTFVMVLHLARSSGTHNPVQGGRVVFRFEPRCARGPCGVRWTIRDRDTDMRLARDGTTYVARGRTPLLLRNCLGDEVDETVKARLRVVSATVRHGRWQATKIEGTLWERSAWEGCMTASITWDVHGISRWKGSQE